MSSDVPSGTAANAESACQSGMEFLSRGDLTAASRAFRTAIGITPSLAQAHLGLGNSLRRQHQSREAESALRHAQKLDPTLREASFSLAFLLHGAGRDTEAASVLVEMAADQASDLTLQRQIAGLLIDFGCFVDAEPLARRIAAAAPAAGAFQRLGLCLLQLERMAEAEEAFALAIQHDPKAGPAYLLMSQTRRATEADRGQLSKFQAVLEHDKITGESRACLHFALGNWFEDLGDYAAAWTQFSAGNRLRHGERSFDRAAWENYFQRLLSIALKVDINESKASEETPQPLFLVGLPGANPEPLSSLLASHPAVCGLGTSGQVDSLARACEQLADETYPECLAKIETTQFAGLERGTRDAWPEKSKNSKWVLDESPLNFLHVALIVRVFPESRVIYQYRQPMDDCLSAYLCPSPHPIYSHVHDLQNLAFFYRQFSTVMNQWQTSLTAKSLLKFCVTPASGGSAPETDAIWKFLELNISSPGGAWHPISRPLPPVDLQRRDVPGRWRNYREHLAPIFEAAGLGPD